MIMSIKRLIAAAAVLAAAACGKNDDGGNGHSPEPPVTERPEELVLNGFTAYPSGENACVDSYLTLKFPETPQLGTSGKIRILDAGGAEVDMIDMEDVAAGKPQMTGQTAFNTAMDAIGTSYTGRYRIVYYDPVTVDGTTVRIKLHCGSLDYGGSYSVEIDPEVILSDSFGGVAAGEWKFSVMAGQERKSEVTVGSRDCDFMTVQGAVNFANSCGQGFDMTINVSAGFYDELLYIRTKNNLTIKGAGPGATVIRADNCEDYVNGVGSGASSVPSAGSPVGTAGGRSVVLVEGCDMLRFENLTIENVHGHGCQAEAIYFNSDDGRLIAENCRFTSEQDTVELKGWCLFRQCRITGDVDFIWGYAKAALFESCEINSCANEAGGYIVQARCAKDDRGFVFLDCDITAQTGVDDGSVWLARSGGDPKYYDNVTYVNCRMADHIAAAGWHSGKTPNPAGATAENGWKEYGSRNSFGYAADVSSRYGGSIQLSDDAFNTLYRDAASIFASCPHGTDWVN